MSLLLMAPFDFSYNELTNDINNLLLTNETKLEFHPCLLY
jgi:hypothetical protein